jgi:TetR/AcrR family transcriptional regulator, cholesterol catabolism regulator
MVATSQTIGNASLRSKKYAGARRALFEAAMELFREKGFDETSVDEIVERAGFSRATFFNHFGNKSAVLRHYGEELQERVHQLLSSIAAGVPPLDRLKQVLLAMAKDAQAHRKELKLVFANSIHDEAYLARPTPARQRTLKMLADLIAEGQSKGEVRRDLSAEEQARQLLGLYNNALLMIIFGGRNARAAIEPMWSFAIGGLCGRHTLAE